LHVAGAVDLLDLLLHCLVVHARILRGVGTPGPIICQPACVARTLRDCPPGRVARRETYPPMSRTWHRAVVSGYDRLNLPLPDGRTLEVFVGGAEAGIPLVYHNGPPSSGRSYAL